MTKKLLKIWCDTILTRNERKGFFFLYQSAFLKSVLWQWILYAYEYGVDTDVFCNQRYEIVFWTKLCLLPLLRFLAWPGLSLFRGKISIQTSCMKSQSSITLNPNVIVYNGSVLPVRSSRLLLFVLCVFYKEFVKRPRSAKVSIKTKGLWIFLNGDQKLLCLKLSLLGVVFIPYRGWICQ